MQESTIIIAKGGTVVWTVPSGLAGAQASAPTGGATLDVQGFGGTWMPVMGYPFELSAGLQLRISAPTADGQVPIRLPELPAPLTLYGPTPAGGLLADYYAGYVLAGVDGAAVTAEHDSGSGYTTLVPPTLIPPGTLRLTRADDSGQLSRVRFGLASALGVPETPDDSGTPAGILSSGVGQQIPIGAGSPIYYLVTLDSPGHLVIKLSDGLPHGGWLSVVSDEDGLDQDGGSMTGDLSERRFDLPAGTYRLVLYDLGNSGALITATWGGAIIPGLSDLQNGVERRFTLAADAVVWRVTLEQPANMRVTLTALTEGGQVPPIVSIHGPDGQAIGGVYDGESILAMPQGTSEIRLPQEQWRPQVELALTATWGPDILLPNQLANGQAREFTVQAAAMPEYFFVLDEPSRVTLEATSDAPLEVAPGVTLRELREGEYESVGHGDLKDGPVTLTAELGAGRQIVGLMNDGPAVNVTLKATWEPSLPDTSAS